MSLQQADTHTDSSETDASTITNEFSDFEIRFGIWGTKIILSSIKRVDISIENRTLIQLVLSFLYKTSKKGHINITIYEEVSSIKLKTSSDEFVIEKVGILFEKIKEILVEYGNTQFAIISVNHSQNPPQLQLAFQCNKRFCQIVKSIFTIMIESPNKFYKTQLHTDNISTIIEKSPQLLVIAGGAGSGKTSYACNIVLNQLKQSANVKIYIAAPTGQATQNFKTRIQEKLIYHDIQIQQLDIQITFSTIHSLLKKSNYYSNYIYNQECKNIDILIVDESSMIGYPTMAYILNFFSNVQIILIGDPLQILPIEQGVPFHDIINQLETHPDKHNTLIQLTGKQRFATNIANNLSINKINSLPEIVLASKKQHSGIQLLPIKDLVSMYEQIFRIITNVYSKLLDTSSDIKSMLYSLNNLIILSPRKISVLGSNHINMIITSLWERLHEDQQQAKICYPIIVIKNDFDRQIYNGTRGVLINTLVGTSKQAYIYTLVNNKIISFNALSVAYEFAFAATVHKCQGSEYKTVIFIIPPKWEIDDSLIHTAITRAQDEILVFCEEELINHSLTGSSLVI